MSRGSILDTPHPVATKDIRCSGLAPRLNRIPDLVRLARRTSLHSSSVVGEARANQRKSGPIRVLPERASRRTNGHLAPRTRHRIPTARQPGPTRLSCTGSLDIAATVPDVAARLGSTRNGSTATRAPTTDSATAGTEQCGTCFPSPRKTPDDRLPTGAWCHCGQFPGVRVQSDGGAVGGVLTDAALGTRGDSGPPVRTGEASGRVERVLEHPAERVVQQPVQALNLGRGRRWCPHHGVGQF